MATFTNQSKNTDTYTNETFSFDRVDLLIGDGFKLLIESPFKLDIELTRGGGFSNQTKNSDTYTNQTKN